LSVVCYADDIVLILEEGQTNEALDFAKTLFKEFGLTISEEKCEGTHLGEQK